MTIKTVPVEPTLEMLKAGYAALKLFFPNDAGHIGHYRVYEAMLNAAPSMPTRDQVIEEVAQMLSSEYRGNDNTNAFCAAVRSMKSKA